MNTSPARPVCLALAVGMAIGLLGEPVLAAAGPATALAFQTQPGGGPATVAWSQQPVVRIIDASSQTVTTSSAAVTLAIGITQAAERCPATVG